MVIPQYPGAQVVLNSLPRPSGVDCCEHVVEDIFSWLKDALSATIEWLTQPQVLPVVMAWCITFMVFCAFASLLGFGPGGVVAYSAAAAFQSWAYGGFTPAGGVFATLTSMAMLGTLWPLMFASAVFWATVVAVIVWACGAGT